MSGINDTVNSSSSINGFIHKDQKNIPAIRNPRESLRNIPSANSLDSCNSNNRSTLSPYISNIIHYILYIILVFLIFYCFYINSSKKRRLVSGPAKSPRSPFPLEPDPQPKPGASSSVSEDSDRFYDLVGIIAHRGTLSQVERLNR